MELFEGTKYKLRPYQVEAVDAAVRFLTSGTGNAIEVLPTGSGKSLIIAGIARKLNAPVLILQPSKEILEQNIAKYQSYGEYASIYSASVGQKRVSRVTFATIGSIKSKAELFGHFPHIIIDECHGVNAKHGMYKEFLEEHSGRVLGLTATPYRLTTDGFGGSILKFLTRTRPRVFEHLIYYVQNGQLFQDGHLARLEYENQKGFDRASLRVNSTGADYTDLSIQKYYRKSNFKDRIVGKAHEVIESRKNCLIFTRFTEESEYLVSKIPQSAIVTAETPKRDRERIIEGFRSGRIKVVCNVGVLTIGFDYPELETIILARPTMSLALYYQMIGRSIRPHPEKDSALIIDMCGNFDLFGKVEDLRIVDGRNGKYYIESKGRQLTNVYYGERY